MTSLRVMPVFSLAPRAVLRRGPEKPVKNEFEWGVRYPLAAGPWDFEAEEEWFKDASPENRGQAKALWKIGLPHVAKRLGACQQFGRRHKCPNCGCERKESWRCKVRTCLGCAEANHDRLFDKYLGLNSLIPSEWHCRPGWGWKILDFAFRSNRDGSMPTNEELREGAQVMHRVIKRVIGIVARKKKKPWIRKQWGYIRCTEFGFDGNNYHAHGAFFGPWIPQALLSRLFAEETNGKSFVVWVATAEGRTPQEAYRSALAHALKYTKKLPASTPEGLARLEKSLQGTRVVQTMGIFYNAKLPEPFSGSPRCPGCRTEMIAISAWVPIGRLVGIPELREKSFGEVVASGHRARDWE